MKNILRKSCFIALLWIAACGGDAVDEQMKTQIRTLLENGAAFDDPFVRAETLRTVTELNDPEFVSIVQNMKSDNSPMVRVAVLRALLAANDESARSAALNGFTSGGLLERRAILHAVYRYGDAPLKAELTARAMRSKSDELKRIAFENGYLKRIDDAIAAKDDKLLERTLYPELGRYITQRDPQLAALALRKLTSVGQGERAKPLVDTLSKRSASDDDKLVAAKILAKAGAASAQPAFRALIADHEAALRDAKLGVPDEVVPPAILRWAYLGLAASGDASFVSSANRYRIKATVSESIEVLEALALNPSEDALIAIRNAMKDARVHVRQRAIELYASRNDADVISLNDALMGADHDTNVRLSRILIDRFGDAWVPMLKRRFKRTNEIDPTLLMLRDIVTTKADADAVLLPLKGEFEALATDPNEDRAKIARYLLAISDIESRIDSKLLESFDQDTLYGFLEFAGRAAPATYKDVFKEQFYSDAFALRLASAAGLWRAARRE